MLTRLFVAALLTLAAACGSPESGDSCSPENSIACSDSVNALFCEGGALKAYSCRGPGGCISNGSTASCDVQRALAGEPCPRQVEGQAQCGASSANQALQCTSGTWKAVACNACAVQGGNIVCQP